MTLYIIKDFDLLPTGSSPNDLSVTRSSAVRLLDELKREYESFPDSPSRLWLLRKIKHYEAFLKRLEAEIGKE